MIRRTTVFAFSLALLAAGPVLAAEAPAPVVTAGTTRLEGLAPVYLDKAKGRILMALPAPDADGVSGRYLYLTALRTGLGSAPVGLDRAAAGQSQILVFRRIGTHHSSGSNRVKQQHNKPSEVRSALTEHKRVFIVVGLFSAFINLLYLSPSLYMLQVYDRVISSSNLLTLTMLSVLLLGVYLIDRKSVV